MVVIKVKNLMDENAVNPWDVIVDQRSILGNPFEDYQIISRDAAYEAYKSYFYRRIISDDMAFLDEVRLLSNIFLKYEKLNLFCWCAHEKCHAYIIKEYLKKTINEKIKYLEKLSSVGRIKLL